MSDSGTEPTDRKERLRDRLRARRRDLPERTRREAASEVCAELEAWNRLEELPVGGYLSFDNEVDVSAFLERRLAEGTPVGLPRVEDDEEMHFVEVASLDEVEEGAFGILEPVGSRSRVGEFEMFLVPGVGFDRGGRRLGMGWGYYDRVLQRRRGAEEAADALFVGICYECQLVDEPLPTEAHDVEMDAVVTEREMIGCSERVRRGE